jgi:anthranilate phosphoribosyltransferase
MPMQQITGGNPQENARRLADLLAGEGGEADTAVVALNAGALLMTAGKAPTLREGVGLASAAIAEGRANATLKAFVEASRG